MQQHIIFAGSSAAAKTEDAAMVVALDRQADEEIILRFLIDGGWVGESKQVRLTRGLAEQLMQMLAEELEESSQPFHYHYA